MDGVIMEAIEALALVGGHVDEDLVLRNEYLAAENEILRFSNRLSHYVRFPAAGIPLRLG